MAQTMRPLLRRAHAHGNSDSQHPHKKPGMVTAVYPSPRWLETGSLKLSGQPAGVSEMTEQVKVPATKADGLCLVSRTPVVERLLQGVL